MSRTLMYGTRQLLNVLKSPNFLTLDVCQVSQQMSLLRVDSISEHRP